MKLWQIKSNSPVETPGITWGPIISSTFDARAPAIRILMISSGDFIDTGIFIDTFVW
jgi:hypothetical protein